jgi:PPOX class probable F420-dependent enzyme
MDAAAARAFVDANHHAVLSTRRRDGTPQLSPVVVAADPTGLLAISTREPAMKVRNLRRDPAYDLVVISDRFFGPWVAIRGTATVVALPEAMPLLVEYYRRVSGEHPDWDEYQAAMLAEQRVLVQLTIDEVGPQVSG